MAISLHESYEECRQLNRYYGTPFYNALVLFPKQVQPHIDAVCAYTRIIQQVIDQPKEGVTKALQRKTIKNFLRDFDDGYKESHSSHNFLQAIVHTAKHCDIPPKYFHDFAKAMLRDMSQKHYDSYASLKKHIDDTSGILAMMITRILKSPDEKAVTQMKRLARAGQLIKIICNASKDFDLHNRIYLGAKDLKKFGYEIEELKEKKINDSWRDLIEHYLQEAEKEVNPMQKGLANFPDHSHRALHTTSQIYLDLIERIRRMDYNTFSRRPDVAWAHRIRCALPF